jgi:hypothetical protein
MANHRQTFELTDTVSDRRMSCFFAAWALERARRR